VNISLFSERNTLLGEQNSFVDIAFHFGHPHEKNNNLPRRISGKLMTNFLKIALSETFLGSLTIGHPGGDAAAPASAP